jgi:hypothetical protein
MRKKFVCFLIISLLTMGVYLAVLAACDNSPNQLG